MVIKAQKTGDDNSASLKTMIQEVEIISDALDSKAELKDINAVNLRLNEIPSKKEIKNLRVDLFETIKSFKEKVQAFEIEMIKQTNIL